MIAIDRKFMRSFLRYAFIGLSIGLVLILLWASLEKISTLKKVNVHPETFSNDSIEYHYRNHLPLAYFHIIPGILFLLLGAYQFVPYFRNKYRKLHRLIGKLFLSLSTVIFSTAILLALFFPFGNWVETAVTVIFGSYLIYCTFLAYISAKRRQFSKHQNWVTRIYFIAIAVSTISGIIALFMATGNYTIQDVFGLSFLLAFSLHFIIVEFCIRYLAIK